MPIKRRVEPAKEPASLAQTKSLERIRAEERRERRRHLVTIPPLISLIVSGYLLYNDFKQEERAEGMGQSIAKSTESTGSVRRRFDKRLAWYDFTGLRGIYDKDSIRTNAESGTVIELPDGSKLTVGESSLITIKQAKGGRILIDFQGGSLKADTAGAGVLIQSQGMVLDTKGGKVELSGSGDFSMPRHCSIERRIGAPASEG